jgi:glycogen debranching enzyme
MVDDSPLPATGAGSALAVLAPGLATEQVRSLAHEVLDGRLASPYGVRTLPGDDPEYSPRKYWRGPVWSNVSWLCAYGLDQHGEHDAAATLRARMLDAVEGGGMREYFVPDSGRGLGTHNFTWTAALALRTADAEARAGRRNAA